MPSCLACSKSVELNQLRPGLHLPSTIDLGSKLPVQLAGFESGVAMECGPWIIGSERDPTQTIDDHPPLIPLLQAVLARKDLLHVPNFECKNVVSFRDCSHAMYL